MLYGQHLWCWLSSLPVESNVDNSLQHGHRPYVTFFAWLQVVTGRQWLSLSG
jgi:hypothetical protein